MDELDKNIADLQSTTQETNCEFVSSVLDNCLSAVEKGFRELELGNWEAAQEESQKAEKGYKTVVGFLAEVGEEENRAKIEERWNTLRARLDTLHTLLKESEVG